MKRPSGFTLTELLITVAVIGILAAIALPSYQESVRKSRRGDAKTALSNAAQALERYYTERNTYVGATLGDSGTAIFPDHAPSDGAHGDADYTLAITNQTATSYTLEAAPVGVMAGDPCGTFTLDHLGQKGSADTSRCW